MDLGCARGGLGRIGMCGAVLCSAAIPVQEATAFYEAPSNTFLMQVFSTNASPPRSAIALASLLRTPS